jgi:hypothetical protein
VRQSGGVGLEQRARRRVCDGPAWLAHQRLLDYLAGVGGGRPAERFAELVSAR